MESLDRWQHLRRQYNTCLSRPSSSGSQKKVTFNFAEQFTIQELRNMREWREIELNMLLKKQQENFDDYVEASFGNNQELPTFRPENPFVLEEQKQSDQGTLINNQISRIDLDNSSQSLPSFKLEETPKNDSGDDSLMVKQEYDKSEDEQISAEDLLLKHQLEQKAGLLRQQTLMQEAKYQQFQYQRADSMLARYEIGDTQIESENPQSLITYKEEETQKDDWLEDENLDNLYQELSFDRQLRRASSQLNPQIEQFSFEVSQRSYNEIIQQMYKGFYQRLLKDDLERMYIRAKRLQVYHKQSQMLDIESPDQSSKSIEVDMQNEQKRVELNVFKTDSLLFDIDYPAQQNLIQSQEGLQLESNYQKKLNIQRKESAYFAIGSKQEIIDDEPLLVSPRQLNIQRKESSYFNISPQEHKKLVESQESLDINQSPTRNLNIQSRKSTYFDIQPQEHKKIVQKLSGFEFEGFQYEMQEELKSSSEEDEAFKQPEGQIQFEVGLDQLSEYNRKNQLYNGFIMIKEYAVQKRLSIGFDQFSKTNRLANLQNAFQKIKQFKSNSSRMLEKLFSQTISGFQQK